ncbi:MAG: hypothetical protein ACREVI_05385 [Steroidobacteraceae bacterium]
MIPSTGTSISARLRQAMHAPPLPAKLVLAIVSGCTYGLMAWLTERSEAFDVLLSRGKAAWHLIAIVFGALVMAPYASASPRPLLRALAMCIASAAIYYSSVRFIVDGPFGYDSLAPFLLVGGAAALLVGGAVTLLSSQRFSALLVYWTLAAGAAGGATFDVDFGLASDLNLAVAHVAWQALVCIALHFGFRQSRT